MPAPTAIDWIDAKTATALLGVSRATLYAYVSRGFVRSQSGGGRSSREKRYAREDVDRLRTRATARRRPDRGIERTLQWGVPVVESSLTLVADGQLYYRGEDVADLAHTRSISEVAALLWTGTFEPGFLDTSLHVVSGRASAGLPFLSRAQSVLPLVAARDPLAYDLRPKGVAQTGWRILNLLTSIAVESSELEETIEDSLVRHWKVRGRMAPAILRAAMILSADHDLNVTAFTARCVASSGSSPYSVVLAGLASLEGPKAGGVMMRIESLFDELRHERELSRALSERLRRGDSVDGFGHPLYPQGDPRAVLLLGMLPPSKEHEFARSLIAAAEDVVGESPTLDVALVAIERALALPPGAALTLFAVGRTIGWIAHAIEQYAHSPVIHPRTKYVGRMP